MCSVWRARGENVKSNRKNKYKMMKRVACCFGYSVNVVLTIQQLQEKDARITPEYMQELEAGSYVFANRAPSSQTQYSAESKLFDRIDDVRRQRLALWVSVVGAVFAAASFLVSIYFNFC